MIAIAEESNKLEKVLIDSPTAWKTNRPSVGFVCEIVGAGDVAGHGIRNFVGGDGIAAASLQDGQDGRLKVVPSSKLKTGNPSGFQLGTWNSKVMSLPRSDDSALRFLRAY